MSNKPVSKINKIFKVGSSSFEMMYKESGAIWCISITTSSYNAHYISFNSLIWRVSL